VFAPHNVSTFVVYPVYSLEVSLVFIYSSAVKKSRKCIAKFCLFCYMYKVGFLFFFF